MIPAITFEEILAWNDEASHLWKAHLDANPLLLQLPCGIGGNADVQAFVRHIWGAELLWAQRIANLPETAKTDWPTGPLDALFGLHQKAVEIYLGLMNDSHINWNEPMKLNYPWLPEALQQPTRRKTLGHALFHSQRHWAQLSTLVRQAGFPSGLMGDLLFSLRLT
jgi:uncharacterized damage-inducible protein DinB